MSARSKHNYPVLIDEYDQRRVSGEPLGAIKSDFESRGVNWGTFQNRRSQANRDKEAKASPVEEPPMNVQLDPLPTDPVTVLPGQMSIEDANTPAEVHYGAVYEVDALPDGYAKEIQPMRPYSDAEEWALNKSMDLYGFIGAIVRDQFGRILDGNQRQRIARLRGLAVPHTIRPVKDDAEAMEIALTMNTVKRYYPREQRLELAGLMREQGFSYREMAVALGVSKDTVQRDIFGTYKVIAAPEPTAEIVSNETIPGDTHETIVSNETMPNVTSEPQPSPAHKFPERVKRKDAKGTYPAQRPTGRKPQPSKSFDAQKIEERIKDLYMGWLGRCEDEDALNRAESFLNTLRTFAEGRAKLVLQTE